VWAIFEVEFGRKSVLVSIFRLKKRCFLSICQNVNLKNLIHRTFLFQLIHQIRIVNQNRQVKKEKVSGRKSSISSMYQSQISNVPSYYSLSVQTSNQKCKSESSGEKRKNPWENYRKSQISIIHRTIFS